MNKKSVFRVILTIISLDLAFIPSLFSLGGNFAPSTALLWTDKKDYAPGETVSIYGSGFQAGETLVLQILRPTGTDWLVAKADASGSIEVEYRLTPERAMSGTYEVLAIDPIGGQIVASTSFSDSPPQYYIAITKINGIPISEIQPETVFSGPIHLEGIANATNFPGQLWQYQVQIDWGDGIIDPNSYVSFTQYGDNFNGTWHSDPDHTYSIAGLISITVKLYHTQPPGHEGSGDVAFTINVRIVRQIRVIADPEVASGKFFTVTYTKNGNTITETKTTPWKESVDDGSRVTITNPESPIISGATQYVFQTYEPSQNVTMDADKTITLRYKTQYYLTVSSPYGTTNGEGWYDSGTNAYAGLDVDSIYHENSTRHMFAQWSGDASGTNYSQSDAIVMDGPKTAQTSLKQS
ncbi:MAG: hypothetical protein QXO94_05830 [Candidatus Bathyarchaeia archaeon]